MKYRAIPFFCLVFLAGNLVGCQNYPKKPAYVSTWANDLPVNRFVPNELTPFVLPKKSEFVPSDDKVPTKIIVVHPVSNLVGNDTDNAVVVPQPPIGQEQIVTENQIAVVGLSAPEQEQDQFKPKPLYNNLNKKAVFTTSISRNYHVQPIQVIFSDENEGNLEKIEEGN